VEAAKPQGRTGRYAVVAIIAFICGIFVSAKTWQDSGSQRRQRPDWLVAPYEQEPARKLLASEIHGDRQLMSDFADILLEPENHEILTLFIARPGMWENVDWEYATEGQARLLINILERLPLERDPLLALTVTQRLGDNRYVSTSGTDSSILPWERIHWVGQSPTVHELALGWLRETYPDEQADDYSEWVKVIFDLED